MQTITMTKKAFLGFVQNCGISKETPRCRWGKYVEYARMSSSIEVQLEDGSIVLPSMVGFDE
jgi:hypothetical protein